MILHMKIRHALGLEDDEPNTILSWEQTGEWNEPHNFSVESYQDDSMGSRHNQTFCENAGSRVAFLYAFWILSGA